jgi:hypothetical protein
MPLSPEEMRRKLTELENEMNLAMQASTNVEQARQYTELQSVLADLRSRFGQFIEAGLELIAAVMETIEAAATGLWRWLNA